MKIYGFFNAVQDFRDAVAVAIDENGSILATHVSSNESFAKMDLGMDGISKSKHDRYDAAHPEGWEYEFVHISDNRDNHVGLQAAVAKHRQIQAETPKSEE